MRIIAQKKFEAKSEPDRPVAECRLADYGARATHNSKLGEETI
jgi:hypothetical protein